MAAKSWLSMSNWTAGKETFAGAIGLGKYIKYPRLTAQLPGQANAASTPATPTTPGAPNTPNPTPNTAPTTPASPGGTGVKAIFDALIKVGASPAQAIGIMANMINESSLNPESAAMDSNGAMSYGLVSWNAAAYPTASSLVTGNPAKDIAAQINFLVQTGGLRAASGSTGSQVASNFAANYERCVGCQSGGHQNAARMANVPGLAKQLGVTTT